MPNALGRHASPWADTLTMPALGDTGFRADPADVVVVGAGIVGLTTALLLQEAGRQVTVVEQETLAASVTVHSTVKVTVGHGTAYSRIARTGGMAASRVYAEANRAGFDLVLRLAREFPGGCQLEDGLPHVVYAESEQDASAVEDEAEITRLLGLDVALVADPPLPFPVARALAFADQAQFHPGRYLAGLAERFVAAGGRVIEHTRAMDVDERPDGCVVDTTAGRIPAGHVVVATQYPFLDRGLQFTRLTARRSYGIAGVLPDGVVAGMTISTGASTRSTRTVQLGQERLLVVVGEGHPVGHESDTASRWGTLQSWARERFEVEQVRYHWSAQETTSIDHLPLVGPVGPRSSRVLTATGFDGWGMTNGSAAALLLRDGVLGRDNPWQETFDARRATTSVPPLGSFVRQNAHVATTWLKDRVHGAPVGDPAALQPGDAALLEADGVQTAAYRDDDGRLHAVSAVCTHLGCTVAWNAAETSWDCPCHGSRFGPDGRVLHGPATAPLEPRDVGQ